jgi:ATP-binding cassette subfamily B (MDR/TAP) protein 1
VQLHAVEGRIVLRDVHFSYPTRPEQPVLDGFNLVVEPGQTVALCGASGSGKSTVIALLERFYDPDPMDEAKRTTPAGVSGGSGAVELDGYDIRTLDLRFLRGCMSLVSQEPRLFAGSVAENISCESAPVPVEFNDVRVCSVVPSECSIYRRS